MRKKGFTLLEVIIAITIFFLLLVVVFGLYTKMLRLKYNIQAKQALIQNSYDAMEKVNLLLKNYSIDYEEYFNRMNVGCNGANGGANFTWNIQDQLLGHCTNESAYGNSGMNSSSHKFYYCTSAPEEFTPNRVLNTPYDPANGILWSGCENLGQQAFGQYARQGWNMGRDVDTLSGAVNDGDDRNMFRLPDAILDSTGVKELYLISPDKKQRIFLRKVFVESGDWNGDGQISGDSEYLYTLQMLKLRGFDAGNNHNFNPSSSSGVYDGVIDTWACDYALGFQCSGSSIGGAYANYRLPSSHDDGWVNLFDLDLTVAEWNLIIFPTKDPEYALAVDDAQISPYFTIKLTNKLYGKIWYRKLGLPSLDDFQLTLQTTFSTKTWYTK